MSESSLFKRPTRLTASDMLGDFTGQVNERSTVKPNLSYGSHGMQVTAQVQRGTPGNLQENFRPSVERFGTSPTIYTHPSAQGIDPLKTSLQSNPGIVTFGANGDFQRREAAKIREFNVYQKTPGPVYNQSLSDNTSIRGPSTLKSFNDMRTSAAGPRRDSWSAIDNPPAAFANPGLFNYSTDVSNYHDGNYQQPAVPDSVMPRQGSFHSFRLGGRDSRSTSQTNNDMSNLAFASNFRPIQECHHPQLYQDTLSTTAYDIEGGRAQPHVTSGSNSDSQKIPLTKYKKLCNNYHLRGACLVGNACRYVHGVISQAELRELRRIAKGLVCKFGLNCSDEFCYAGHKCPFDSHLAQHCHFPDNMHYDGPEETRGRMETDVNLRIGNGNYHGPFKQEPLKSEDQSTSSHQELDLNPLAEPQMRHNEQELSISTRQQSIHRDQIEKEVEQLFEDIAPSNKGKSSSPRASIALGREVTELDLDRFEDTLAKSLRGSQANSSPQQQGTQKQDQAKLLKTPQPCPQEIVALAFSNAKQPDSNRNVSKRPRGSESSSFKETKEGLVKVKAEAPSPEHHPKRRARRSSYRPPFIAGAHGSSIRQQREASPQRVDSWRPNWHPKGDYWRPHDEWRGA